MSGETVCGSVQGATLGQHMGPRDTGEGRRDPPYRPSKPCPEALPVVDLRAILATAVLSPYLDLEDFASLLNTNRRLIRNIISLSILKLSL